jgi:hypothetical protein
VLLSVYLGVVLALPIILIFVKQYERYMEKTASGSLVYNPLSPASLLAMLAGSVTLSFKAGDGLQVLALLAVLSGSIILFRNGRKAIAVALLATVFLSWLIAFAISRNNIDITARYLIHIFLLAWVLAALAFVDTQDKLSRGLQVFSALAIGAVLMFGFYRAATRVYSYPDWRAIAQILEREAKANEPIVIMGWDAAPTGYYLDREYLSSYQLEEQLSQGTTRSYLILDSANARRLDFIDYTKTIYENLRQAVRIIRYRPAANREP